MNGIKGNWIAHISLDLKLAKTYHYATILEKAIIM
jgi:hypothetical protein